MKKLISLLISFSVVGCVPYEQQTNLADGLLISGYTNERILNTINSHRAIKATRIDYTGGMIYGSDDFTERPAIATLSDGSYSQGYLQSTGRWSNDVHVVFVTEDERKVQKEKEERERQKRIEDIKREAEEESKKNEKEFNTASIKRFPYEAELFCYDSRSFELYMPSSCNLSVTGNMGPTNFFDKQAPSKRIMLERNYKLKFMMYTANPTINMRVNIISRSSGKVIASKDGNYFNSIFIAN
ncbi:TPA: hypothetical protein J1190_004121 [Escherichia coli]|nr:hypothetical protein [Escherichia coli]